MMSSNGSDLADANIILVAFLIYKSKIITEDGPARVAAIPFLLSTSNIMRMRNLINAYTALMTVIYRVTDYFYSQSFPQTRLRV